MLKPVDQALPAAKAVARKSASESVSKSDDCVAASALLLRPSVSELSLWVIATREAALILARPTARAAAVAVLETPAESLPSVVCSAALILAMVTLAEV